MVTASAVSGKLRSLGSRERLKSDGIGLAVGRIRRIHELTPWMGLGLVTALVYLSPARDGGMTGEENFC
jgi:hypothetical protein